MPDKTNLLLHLESERNACKLGLAMLVLVRHEPSMEYLASQALGIAQTTIIANPTDSAVERFTYEKITTFANHVDTVSGAPAMEFTKSVFRSLFNVSYESVKSYCEDTNQMPKFTSQPWYQFFRSIRNSLTHDFYFSLSRDKQGALIESEWNGRSILAAMDGQPLTLDFIGFSDLLEMHDVLRTFVANELA
jgi:hypothetical protein